MILALGTIPTSASALVTIATHVLAESFANNRSRSAVMTDSEILYVVPYDFNLHHLRQHIVKWLRSGGISSRGGPPAPCRSLHCDNG